MFLYFKTARGTRVSRESRISWKPHCTSGLHPLHRLISSALRLFFSRRISNALDDGFRFIKCHRRETPRNATDAVNGVRAYDSVRKQACVERRDAEVSAAHRGGDAPAGTAHFTPRRRLPTPRSETASLHLLLEHNPQHHAECSSQASRKLDGDLVFSRSTCDFCLLSSV